MPIEYIAKPRPVFIPCPDEENRRTWVGICEERCGKQETCQAWQEHRIALKKRDRKAQGRRFALRG
jgi:hypothetical protein